MMKNRSVPSETVVPHVAYQSLPDALDWLARVFGFVEHFRYGVPISGAQVFANKACIMLIAAKAQPGPARAGSGTQRLTIFVEDVDAHYARARSEGAEIAEEPHETVYGEYQYAALDPDGHLWIFSRHARDLSPEEWGATLAAGYK